MFVTLSRGYVALVDADDYDLVCEFKWYAQVQDHTVYAVRDVGNGAMQYMHRLLTGFERTDHVNGNGLDNRRANLRSCTQRQNLGNTRKRAGSSSYKGVSWMSARGKWRAMIQFRGRKRHLGVFGTEDAAARAYDQAARESFGDFAALNFPLPGEQSALRKAA